MEIFTAGEFGEYCTHCIPGFNGMAFLKRRKNE
jgi:hypothetical protein